jgi:hypothetical protein
MDSRSYGADNVAHLEVMGRILLCSCCHVLDCNFGTSVPYGSKSAAVFGSLFHISFISFNQSLQVNGSSDIEHVTVGVFTIISQRITVIMHKYKGCR